MTIQGMLSQLFVALKAETFESNLGKKLVALGLTSLLSLPRASLPAPVIQVLPHAFGTIVNVSRWYSAPQFCLTVIGTVSWAWRGTSSPLRNGQTNDISASSFDDGGNRI